MTPTDTVTLDIVAGGKHVVVDVVNVDPTKLAKFISGASHTDRVRVEADQLEDLFAKDAPSGGGSTT